MIKTLLRYPGGKSKAIVLITHVKDYDRIISPFIGGGSLEIHWSACHLNLVGLQINFRRKINYIKLLT
jgi:site-specific DNA-adenine methylase